MHISHAGAEARPLSHPLLLSHAQSQEAASEVEQPGLTQDMQGSQAPDVQLAHYFLVLESLVDESAILLTLACVAWFEGHSMCRQHVY